MEGAVNFYNVPNIPLRKKLVKLDESFNCPICGDLFKNPHTLHCGHSYCSSCISRHFDKAFNSICSDTCPTCREKSEVSHMKPNRSLEFVVLAYREARSDILSNLIASSSTRNSAGSSSSSSSSRSRDEPILVTRRMPQLSFHGKPKKFVRDSIEKFCSCSKVKPCLDGDQDELARFYRELIHLNNAQIGSAEPLSFDDVVKEINKKEMLRRKEMKSSQSSKAHAAKMINGEISAAAAKNFSSLTQRIRQDLRDIKAKAASSSSISNSAADSEMSSETEPGEYSEGGWRVIMSDKAGRPFYYNTTTQIGQFIIPEDFTAAALGENEEEEKENQSMTSSSNTQGNAVSSPMVVSAEVHYLCSDTSPVKSVEISATHGRKKRRRNGDVTVVEISAGDKNIPGIKSDIKSEIKSKVTVTDIDSVDSVEVRLLSRSASQASSDKINTGSNKGLNVGSEGSNGCEGSNGPEGCHGSEGSEGSGGVEVVEVDDNKADNIPDNIKDNMMDDMRDHISDRPSQRSSDRSQTQSSSSDISSDICIIDPIEEPSASAESDIGDDNNQLGTTWECGFCTYLNSSEDFSCAICEKASGQSKLRRSQRDGMSGSGTIMHGFALTQLQHSQPNQFNDNRGNNAGNGGNGGNGGNSVRLPSASQSNRRLSSSTSIINLGSNGTNRPNVRRQR